MKNKIRVCIIDDHELIRIGIKSVIESDQMIMVVSEFSCGNNALKSINNLNVDVVILDYKLANTPGTVILNKIKTKFPQMKIICLTAYKIMDVLVRMYQMGADGIVLKDIEPEKMIEVVKSVYNNQNYIQPNLAPELINYYQKNDLFTKLSNREFEVLGMLANNLNEDTIAESLCISVSTVYNTKRNAMKRLKTKDFNMIKKRFIEIM